MITKVHTHFSNDILVAVYFSFFNHKHYKGSMCFENINNELVSDGLEFFGNSFSKPLKDIVKYLKNNTHFNKIKIYFKFEEEKKFEKYLVSFEKNKKYYTYQLPPNLKVRGFYKS